MDDQYRGTTWNSEWNIEQLLREENKALREWNKNLLLDNKKMDEEITSLEEDLDWWRDTCSLYEDGKQTMVDASVEETSVTREEIRQMVEKEVAKYSHWERYSHLAESLKTKEENTDD